MIKTEIIKRLKLNQLVLDTDKFLNKLNQSKYKIVGVSYISDASEGSTSYVSLITYDRGK